MFDFLDSQQRRRTARGASRSTQRSTATRGDGTSERAAKDAPQPAPRVVHSIFGLIEGRAFNGEFAAGRTPIKFSFAPKTAALKEKKLMLTGQLSLRPQGAAEVTLTDVVATLLATQGGVGSSVARRQQAARSLVGNANVADAQQQQEQAKAPELKQEPVAPASQQPGQQTGTPTEYTGERGYVGVMYLKLSPLDAKGLGGTGVGVDLSNVQLNALLAPPDDAARDLHYSYSEIVAAVYDRDGGKIDERRALEALAEINNMLKG